MSSIGRDSAAADSERVDVSVLAAVLNEERFIRDMAATMREQDFDGEIEFLFIDGGSDDATRSILAELAEEDDRIRILSNPRRIKAAGLNIGLEHAKGDYIVSVDGHSYYPRGFVRIGVDRLKRGDVDWVSGGQGPFGRDPWSRRVALALNSFLGTGRSSKWIEQGDGSEPPVGQERELDSGVFGGIWRREVLQAYNGFDEEWAANLDSELAARMLADGKRIVCLPELTARYVPRSSPKALARQYWRYGYYRAKTACRHPSSVGTRQLVPPSLAATTVASAVGPRTVRRLSRAALIAYGFALLLAGARSGARTPGDAIAVPFLLGIMHLSWGGGYIVGLIRFGLPRPNAIVAGQRE